MKNTDINEDHHKWVKFNSEDEETLSLCDLPINNDESSKQEDQSKDDDFDFDFGSCVGSLLTEPEMCVADEVFYQGQILPLRLSVSSDVGAPLIRHDSRNPSRCVSRSESMDHVFSRGFTSLSSRSNSSGSTSSTATTTYKPRIRNQFHAHPSPKPQIHTPSSRSTSAGHRRSTIWRFFRLGLVRTPEIELQNLKARSNNNNNNNRSGTCSRSNSISSSSETSIRESKKKFEKTMKNLGLFKRETIIFGGCKCSSDAIRPIDRASIVVIKNGSGSSNNASGRFYERVEKRDIKQAMSRHRTFEWLKELSVADED